MFNQQSAARKQRLLKLRLPSPDHGHFTLSVRNSTVIFHKTRNVALPVCPRLYLCLYFCLIRSLSTSFYLMLSLSSDLSPYLQYAFFQVSSDLLLLHLASLIWKSTKKNRFFSESFQTTRPRSQISRKHILFFNASPSNPFKLLFIASFSLGLRSWIERGAKWN